ncbi:DUF7665 family protein [Haloferula sp.]|uniref:DUF7665 family protein n=1 Tax=Haloferula sp. TaxID=2497595 RepID=UPI003C78AAAA
MPDSGLSLDEECFCEHLEGFNFLQGVTEGQWGLHEDESVKWPNTVIWVAAAARGESPTRFYLFFDLKHYPKTGPTAYLWDPASKSKLDLTKWPKGSNDVHMVFRATWNNAAALYAPWDRLAAAGHPEWPVKHAGLVWKPDHTIVNYLRPTYELLHSDDYHGA